MLKALVHDNSVHMGFLWAIHIATVVYGPLQPQVFVFDMYEGLMEKPL